jgi:hypothetical protein
LIDTVEDLNHFFRRRDMEVPDGMPRHLDTHSKAVRDTAYDCLVRDESLVPVIGLVLFHQVDNSPDAAFDESTDLFLAAS